MSRLISPPQVFFVGDRVRVRDNADKLVDLLGLGTPMGLPDLLGKEATVCAVFPLGRTHIYVLDNADGVWSDAALEKVTVLQAVPMVK